MSRRVLTPSVRDHLSRPLRRKLAFILRTAETPKEKFLFIGHRKLTAPHVVALLGTRFARMLAMLGMRLGEYLALQLKGIDAGSTAVLFTRAGPLVVWWKPADEVFVEPAPWLTRSLGELRSGEECPPSFDVHGLALHRFDVHGLPPEPVVIPYWCQCQPRQGRGGRLRLDPQGNIEDKVLWIT